MGLSAKLSQIAGLPGYLRIFTVRKDPESDADVI